MEPLEWTVIGVLAGGCIYLFIKNRQLEDRIRRAAEAVRRQQQPYPRRRGRGRIYIFYINGEKRYYSKGYGWISEEEIT